MNAEFYEALDALEKEKNIPKDYMLEKIKAAIAATIKRDRNVPAESVDVVFDREKKTVRAFIRKTVVDEIEYPGLEISLEEANKISNHYQIGDTVEIDVDPSEVGRIAAKVGKNVIVQAINEAVNGSILQEFEGKNGSLVSGIVRSIDAKSGTVMIEIGQYEMPLSVREQIPGERFKEGETVKVCVNVSLPDIKKNTKTKEIILSRVSSAFIEKLFEVEVPEISEGIVEIKAVSREAGSRSKVAVWSTSQNVDAVGACIGPRQSRINSILSNLKGERIDLIKYSEDPGEFVISSLAPAKVHLMEIDVEAKSCKVSVPADQLSLAIGKTGQNVRLAARLTGYRIDIISE